MTVNAELLNKTMEHIEAHPEEHDPTSWGHCIAGRAVVMSGWDLVFREYEDGRTEAILCRNPETGNAALIADAAQILLSITGDDACELFWVGNTRTELRRIVDRIVGN
jgi:hypothetical protein